MTQIELERNLEKAYTQVFYTLLMEKISRCEVVDFDGLSGKNRNDIGNQAGRRAQILAKGFVGEIKRKGYLTRKPTEEELITVFNLYTAELKTKI